MQPLSSPKLLWTLIAVLALICVVLAYLWIDRSISLTYMSASMQTTSEAASQATKLVVHEWKGQTEDAVFANLQLLKEQSKDLDTVLKREPAEGAIRFGHLQFIFKNNQLVEIR